MSTFQEVVHEISDPNRLCGVNQTCLHMENRTYMKQLKTAFKYCISNCLPLQCQNLRPLDIKNTYCDISKMAHVHLQYDYIYTCTFIVFKCKIKISQWWKWWNTMPYLKRYISIHLKFGHHLGPGFKLFAFGINIIVEHSALGRELDSFELGHPPFAELQSIVDQLDSHRDTEGDSV